MSVSLLVVYQKQNATTAAISTDEVVVLSVTVFMGDFSPPSPSSSANDLTENRRLCGVLFFG